MNKIPFSRFFQVAGITLLLAIVVSAQSPSESNPEEMQRMMAGLMQQMEFVQPGTYTNRAFGYELQIPDGWTAVSMGVMLMGFEGQPDLSALAGGYPDVRSIMVMVDTTGQADRKPIDEWNAEEMKSMVEERAEQENINVEVYESGKTELSGKPAFFVNSNLEASGYNISQRIYVTEAANRTVTVLYMCPPDQWQDFSAFINDHIQTFNFID
ncbi:hypothetical protein K8I28_01965 [bacterium]|nr:hypothetical protein [bacterium]